MAKNENKPAISKELQETVKCNPLIKEVYFDRNGKAYFTKHNIEVHTADEFGVSIGSDNIEACPGAKRGLIKVHHFRSGRKELVDAFVNISAEPVTYTMTRKEVMESTPTATDLSEKKQLEILKQASEIAKSGNYDTLLSKLKTV